MALLTLENVSVAYDQQYILKDFNLTVDKGNLISLLGPSGSRQDDDSRG
ncbi:hypothetical protein LJK87_38145 [Paenibacillus sp. P25]|nr:hypothetical protein LJK87_38145 [Paenibacillus sp. P25]